MRCIHVTGWKKQAKPPSKLVQVRPCAQAWPCKQVLYAVYVCLCGCLGEERQAAVKAGAGAARWACQAFCSVRFVKSTLRGVCMCSCPPYDTWLSAAWDLTSVLQLEEVVTVHKKHVMPPVYHMMRCRISCILLSSPHSSAVCCMSCYLYCS
jgi:hypothetical protein